MSVLQSPSLGAFDWVERPQRCSNREETMAKKFFYVCAGLFLLLCTYHLGARRAQAQVGARFVAITQSNSYLSYGLAAITDDDQLYETRDDVSWFPTFRLPGHPVGMMSTSSGRQTYVLMDSGDLYFGDRDNNPSNGKQVSWPPVRIANVASGPVPANLESWGALKARTLKP